MVEPAREPNEAPNTANPEVGDRDLWARALRFTPSYRLIRQEWELGNLLRESIDSGRLGTDLSDQSSELVALKKSLSAYLTDGHKSMKELNRRLERIPELIEESRLHTQSPATPSDAAEPNVPLSPHLQTFIAREAAVCIMERLVTDGLHSCEQTSKEDAIFSFYEGILTDLESLSPSLTDEELDKQLSRIIDQTKEEQLSLKELIDSTITSQEERVADFISGSLEQLQTTQHLPPSDLFSIAPYLYSDFQDRLASRYRKLSEDLHSSLDDAVTQLNDVHKNPQTLPDCIRWFQLSIDALSDEQSDLSSEMADFCVTLVQQTEDTAETAHLRLSHHPAHDEIAAYLSVSDGKDANHLVERLERFTELVNDVVSAKGLDRVDAQRAKSALIQSAYVTALSTFAYQLGEEDREAIRNILEQQGIEPPTPSASHYQSLEKTHETTRGGAEESATELKNLIELFCSRALEHQAGDSVATRLQSAMRAHLLRPHEGAADSIRIKDQVKEVAHFIDTATSESVTSPGDPSPIESAGFTMATIYHELAIATVHSMITTHLEGRKQDLVSRLNTIRETFDPRPPARLNAGEANQSANRRGKEGSRPPTLGEQIRSQCAAVAELFPVYFDEAVEMAGWIVDELCPVLEQGIAVGIAEPWKDKLRTSFERLVQAIKAENTPRSGRN